MKKLFFLLLIILIVYGTYKIFKSNKINYIVLGDYIKEEYSLYIKDYLTKNNKLSYYKDYSKENNNISNLIAEIKYKNEIKKDLRESNLVTISIGVNDIFNINNDLSNIKEKVDNIIPNLNTCIKEIRKYAKQKVIIIGLNNPNPSLIKTYPDIEKIFAYIDEQYRIVANNNNCIYISTYKNQDIFNKIINQIN